MNDPCSKFDPGRGLTHIIELTRSDDGLLSKVQIFHIWLSRFNIRFQSTYRTCVYKLQNGVEVTNRCV